MFLLIVLGLTLKAALLLKAGDIVHELRCQRLLVSLAEVGTPFIDWFSTPTA